MLKLYSNAIEALASTNESKVAVRRVSEANASPGGPLDYCLVRRTSDPVPEGFSGYLFLERPTGAVPQNSFLLDSAMSYLGHGDVVKINPARKSFRALYRRSSRHNAFLLTERCNNYCLMCSQPPRDIDDSYIADEILQAIPLMDADTNSIGLTGGEPTLLGDRLVEILQALKTHLPDTAVHMLSNGRNFKEHKLASTLADVGHSDLMIGIPVYSDISSQHDYVVQAKGAFDDTIRGIINLKGSGVRVEIRVVVHRETYARLPELARFIRRNLTFCDHVAFMGLEMTGFTRFNLEKLWIDPKEYQGKLVEAVTTLARAKMHVSVYNHQLCILDPALYPFNRKSISDWKNEYMSECQECTRKEECGGFFSSAKLRYSRHIRPFLAE